MITGTNCQINKDYDVIMPKFLSFCIFSYLTPIFWGPTTNPYLKTIDLAGMVLPAGWITNQISHNCLYTRVKTCTSTNLRNNFVVRSFVAMNKVSLAVNPAAVLPLRVQSPPISGDPMSAGVECDLMWQTGGSHQQEGVMMMVTPYNVHFPCCIYPDNTGRDRGWLLVRLRSTKDHVNVEADHIWE